MQEGKPKITYHAQQRAGRVVVVAIGQLSATGFGVRFQATPNTAEYRILRQKLPKPMPDVFADVAAHTSFSTDGKIERIVVYDEAGRHEILVLQIPEQEALSRLFINNTYIPVQGVRTNSLIGDACKRFDVDSVEMHTSQSDLGATKLPIVEPDTYSLIYFASGEVELATPLSVPTCLRLTEVDGGNTLAEVFVYDAGEYIRQGYEFSLNGVLGCTAVANLGFCLLRSLHNIATRALSTITITDRAWMDKYEQLDLEVADDPILDFCKSEGEERMRIGAAKSDCEYWSECKDLPGQRCIHNKPVCK